MAQMAQVDISWPGSVQQICVWSFYTQILILASGPILEYLAAWQ